MRLSRWILILLALWISAPVMMAQDGLNLPTELYILRNDGVVDQYGLGNAGIRAVTPPDDFVLDFRVAPDGAWLAYRTQSALFLSNMYTSEPPRMIEGETASIPPIRGRGETIAWSPDSDAIAYTTLTGGRIYFVDSGAVFDLTQPDLQALVWSPDGRYLAAGADQNIWWIFRRDGQSLALVSAIPQAVGISWLNVTTVLFAPPEGGLIAMDIAGGNAQTPILDAFQTYRLPIVQPDNSVLIFVTDETAEPVTGRLLRLRITSAGVNVEEVGLADIALDGLHWAPRGELMVAFQGGVLALTNPVTGDGFTLPITSAAAFGWGPAYPPTTAGLTTPDALYFTAPDSTGIIQVYRMAGDGFPPAAITSAVADVLVFDINADGNRLAYVSDGQLWLVDLTDADTTPLPLVELGLSPTQLATAAPAFDAGSTYLYYRDVQEQGGIYRVNIATGSSELYVPDAPEVAYFQPEPAAGVSALLVQTVESTGDRGFAIYDVTVNERLTFLRTSSANQPDYGDPLWLSGTLVAFSGIYPRGDVPILGLHVIDVNNLDEPIYTLLPLTENSRVLSVARLASNDVRVLVREREPGRVFVLDAPADGGSPNTFAVIGYMTQPRLSPSGALVAGLTHPDGALIGYDLATNQASRLQGFQRIMSFLWR